MTDTTARLASGSQAVSVQELREWIALGPAPRIVDVRDRHLFNAGHIAGAEPCAQYRDIVGLVPEDGLLVVTCDTGERSRAIVGILAATGFLQAKYLAGGMAAWVESNGPRALPDVTTLAVPIAEVSDAALPGQRPIATGRVLSLDDDGVTLDMPGTVVCRTVSVAFLRSDGIAELTIQGSVSRTQRGRIDWLRSTATNVARASNKSLECGEWVGNRAGMSLA